MFDLVIRGGQVFDGSGEPARVADVLITDGAVAAVTPPNAEQAGRELDASGAWVLPGFVDVHTHYDLCLDWDALSAHCLRQGITAVIGGNCGLGDPDVAAVLARAERARLGVHFGVLAPFGPLRSQVVPRAEGRAATAAERDLVRGAVAGALDAGALGLSWGPYHANTLADDDELRAALRPLAGRGLPFVVHRRSEGEDALEATREAVSLAASVGAPLQVSHLKVAGRANWDHMAQVLELLEQARREHDVTVDVYPYDASLTYLSAVLPTELKADGRVHAHLADPAGRARARAGIARWFQDRQGPEQILIHEPGLSLPRGITLLDASARLGLDDPIEAALRLIESDPAGTGGWTTYLAMMAPAHVQEILRLPYAAVASDAVPEEDGSGLGSSTHPRAFSSFVRALLAAADDGPQALADCVRRATAFPADRYRLGRGRLTAGAPADVLVLREPQDMATHRAPAQYPSGVAAVVVGGRVALIDGEPTGESRGELLRA